MFKPDFPEYSNGCTGVEWLWHLFAGRRPCFGKCCDEHDIAYAFSRTSLDKLRADFRFLVCLLRLAMPWCRNCVMRLWRWLGSGLFLVVYILAVAGYLIFACAMYVAVNVLGWPFWLWAQFQQDRGK